MYKDVLEKINKDRKVDNEFMERLEKNGFEINYGKFSYWDSQEYITIGTRDIWLVETYNTNDGGMGCCYRFRNDVVEEIKKVLEIEQEKLKKEQELIDSILPIK